VALGVAAQVADLLVQQRQARLDAAATCDQGERHQHERQPCQRIGARHTPVRGHRLAPLALLPFERDVGRKLREPGQVKRARVGDPEQLFVDGDAHIPRRLQQLLLGQLQLDRRAQEVAIDLLQLIDQFTSRLVQAQQRIHQGRGDLDPSLFQALIGQPFPLA